jgi:hypothetical protein
MMSSNQATGRPILPIAEQRGRGSFDLLPGKCRYPAC